jgi:hypothetical protein
MKTAATKQQPEPQARAALLNWMEILDELQGKKCRCGHRKVAGQTFCRDCFYALPQQMRDDLYKRMGQGYEEAYQAAVDYLAEQKRKRA